MTTVLLIGATGQIGWELARALLPVGQIVAPPRSQFDLAQPRKLGALVDAVKPDVIINAAAYTTVDKAEKEEALARTINADAPAELAAAARRLNAVLVHYSTDYVFDGKSAGAYNEDDATNPASAYGRTKLAGEEAVRASSADYVIYRTSWVYAARGKNFLRTILGLAAEREELRIVADQIGAPTWARLVAEVTSLALRQDLTRRKQECFENGTFHLTATGETSWHGFANTILDGARQRGAILKCDSVMPIRTEDYPLPAVRPPNSRLDGKRLAQRYGLQMPTWRHCADLCLAELFSEKT